MTRAIDGAPFGRAGERDALPPQAPASPRELPWPDDAWREDLASAVTDLGELLHLAGVSAEAVNAAPAGPFPLRVPRPYIARMKRGDPGDPLLRQVLPSRFEWDSVPGYVEDPLAESAAVADAGVLQKYAGRVLLITTGACAVNCRYCFRRHFPYAEHRQAQHFPALDAIRQDASVREVILSGGDPLMLRDTHLTRLLKAIAAIDHVRRVRIHTRLPVVIPKRVTNTLIDMLHSLPQQVVIVLHFNHAGELDDEVDAALAALRPFTLLNQSVVLQGINNDADVLAGLSERLFAAGVLPYYLHLPDAVAGTAHFHVSETEAKALHHELAARLPGYLVPRLVRETPGHPSKELLAG
ncbi:MAG: EF-P beta-lysylation protein EpmB [Gammaproteobacteria bacterium]|nr:EF-P beta-lysylation protein EpmB [Gammaproteobacteria bacterium]